jgi:UDP-2-acetamido-2,6-beta-L-arabino-hexul-4-ose reductase
LRCSRIPAKKAAEDALFAYSKETGNKVYIYRLPNVFGKWCRPNYNSAVATFCHNISHNLEIQVNDPEYILPLVYIDDILEEMRQAIHGKANIKADGYCYVPVTYTIKLLDLVNLLYSFKESRNNLIIPNMANELEKKLYSTYISYFDKNDFKYPLKMNIDNRGSFTEFIKTINNGQVSVNVSKPGITKGNHWHHTKNEKFLVVSGKGLIQFRNINESEIIEYYVSGEKLEVIDIPTGYTHNIINVGDTDLVTIMWANESYDPNHPDTFYQEV